MFFFFGGGGMFFLQINLPHKFTADFHAFCRLTTQIVQYLDQPTPPNVPPSEIRG